MPFLHAPWLLKDYPDTTKNRKERYFIRILRSDRVVSEHALGMLKGRFCIVYKKAKCPRQCKSCYHRLYCTWEDFVLYTKRQNVGDNVKAVIIACIALGKISYCIQKGKMSGTVKKLLSSPVLHFTISVFCCVICVSHTGNSGWRDSSNS